MGCHVIPGTGGEEMNMEKGQNRIELYRRIEGTMKDIQNDFGYHFDFSKGRNDWIIVEYQHDSGDVGLPAALLDVLIRSMERNGLKFIKIFVCSAEEKTLDIVFREIVYGYGE